jgi:type VI secretion system protein VasD
LFDGDIDVLGAEMLQRYEYVISPNQAIAPAPTPTPLHEDTRYIGVIAAYHDIDRAFWRDSVAVSSTDVDYSLTIQLDRLAVRLTLVED